MGNVMSMPNYLDMANLRIYRPPSKPNYDAKGIKFLRTIDGHSIAMCMVTPFEAAVDTLEDYQNRCDALVFSHGNADDIGSCLSYCQWLATSLKVNVFVYDYVNYGHSSKGTTSEDNLHHSIEAVYGYLTAALKIPNEKIFLFGKSLGSIPTIWLGSRDYINILAGIILVSPLASGARIMIQGNHIPKQWMHRLDSIFGPNISYINRVRQPVYIIHGTRDDIIPIRNSYDLWDRLTPRAQYPPLWLDAGHNDIEYLHRSLFISCVQSYVDQRRVDLKDEVVDSLDIDRKTKGSVLDKYSGDASAFISFVEDYPYELEEEHES